MHPKKVKLKWPLAERSVKLDVERLEGQHGNAKFKWSVVDDEKSKESAASFFPSKQGEFEMRSGERKAKFTVPLSRDSDGPASSALALLKIVPATPGVTVGKDSGVVAMRMVCERGMLVVRPTAERAECPKPGSGDAHLTYYVDRQQGAYGKAYAKWKVVTNDEQLTKQLFPKPAGDLHMANAESTATLKIPIRPPTNYTAKSVQVDLLITPVTPGVSVREKGDAARCTVTMSLPEQRDRISFAAQAPLSIITMGEKSFTVPLLREGNLRGDAYVTFAVAGGEGADVIGSGGERRVKFKNRQATASAELHLKRDAKFRRPLELVLRLTSASGADVDEKRSETTIVLQPNDDTPPYEITLGSDDVGSDGFKFDARRTTTLTIPITREGDDLDEDFEAVASTKPVTAVDGSHYEGFDNRRVVIKRGEKTTNVIIRTIKAIYSKEMTFNLLVRYGGEKKDRFSKTMKIRLLPTKRPPSRMQVADGKKGVKVDEDQAVVELQRRNSSQNAEIVAEYETVDGSAKAGVDYQHSAGTFTLKSGERTARVVVPLIEGVRRPSERHFSLVVRDSRLVDDEQATITLPPWDPANEILYPDVVNVSALKSDVAVVTIRRRNPDDADHDLVVPYRTFDGSAKSSVNYVKPLGFESAKIGKGETETQIEVPIMRGKNRRVISFFVLLGAAHRHRVQVDLAPVRKDGPGVLGFPVPQLDVAMDHIQPGVDVIRVPVVRRSGALGAVTVDFYTRDNTAVAGEHYVERSGTITFDDGEQKKYVEVDLIEKGDFTADRNFTVELGTAGGGAELGTKYEIEVRLNAALDPSSPGVIGFDNARVPFTSSYLSDDRRDAIIVYVPVRRTIGYKGDVSVDYFTRDNTAVAGRHYEEKEGTVEFGPTETLKKIEILLTPGPHFHQSCSFSIELGAAYGGAEIGTYETEVILHPVGKRKMTSSAQQDDDSQSSSDDPLSSGESCDDDDDDDVFAARRRLTKRNTKKITKIITTTTTKKLNTTRKSSSTSSSAAKSK
ncbi:MAG: Calx-beta domain-containing protein [Planctomycetota bacterium]